MNTNKKNLIDRLYLAAAIAGKDILAVLKNKVTLINFVVILGMVWFFYFFSTTRPFDKDIDVAVYNESQSELEQLNGIQVGEEYSFSFMELDSVDQMIRNMQYKELGLVVPAGFTQSLEDGDEVVLEGYVLWMDRSIIPEKEASYSAKLTELLGAPVRVEIGDNIVISDHQYPPSQVNSNLMYVIFMSALILLPYIMLEEKENKTMDALQVSPADPLDIVLGKAITGMFYVTIVAAVAYAVNWAAITNWGLSVVAYLLSAVFTVGLALLMGVIFTSGQQMRVWFLVVIFVILVPGMFSREPLLAPWLKTILQWNPASAMLNLFTYGITQGAPASDVWLNVGILLVSNLIVYAAVVWKVSRADR
jgi:ABC-2 type transport system permease protein